MLTNSTTELVVEEVKVSSQAIKFPQYFAAIAVCTGVLAAGSVIGWTANVTEELRRGELNGIEVSDKELSWIGSFAAVGAMVMCIPIGIMCNKLGRKLSLLIFTIPFVGGWLFMIFANSVVMLYVGRFVTGLAGGAFCVGAPLYISEIAEKEIRGRLSSYFQLFLTCGALFANILGYAVSIKINVIVLSILPLLFAFVFVFQPESPILKMKQQRDAEARTILIRLRGNSYDVDAELREIKKALEEERNNSITFKDSIKKKSTKKATLVCFSLMFFQQAGGINAIVFYTSDIFKSAGSSMDEKLAAIIAAIVSIVSVCISSVLIDKLGRRILLVISGTFMAVGLMILGIFFTLQDRELVSKDTLFTIGFIPLLGLSIYLVAFALGYAPIPWMMSAELFPSEIKSIATAAAGTFNWFMAFITTKFYLDLNASLGGDVTFYIFAGVSFVGAIFAFMVVPETKGKSLDQIQRELNGQKTDYDEVQNKR